jgi:ABC-type glycerol-3-phosphate transport system permease component
MHIEGLLLAAGIIILALAVFFYLKWAYRLALRKEKNPQLWIFITIIIPFEIIFIPLYLYYLPDSLKIGG